MDELLANGGRLLVTMALREMPYEEYLRTAHWRRVRKEALARCGWTCVCGQRAWRGHHLSYDRRGDEQPGDVIGLCDGCHDKFHETWIHKSHAELATL